LRDFPQWRPLPAGPAGAGAGGAGAQRRDALLAALEILKARPRRAGGRW